MSAEDRALVDQKILLYLKATHASSLRKHLVVLPKDNEVRNWVEGLLEISHGPS